LAAVDELRSAGYVLVDLDPSATEYQASVALCHDNETLTNPLRLTLLNVTEALNGWSFSSDLVDSDGNSLVTCPVAPIR
jgi:hypothetical protein